MKKYNNFFSVFGRTKEEEEWCVKRAYDFWPLECERIIQIADDVCNKKFIFNMPWDMEPTNKPVCFREKIMWEYKPACDMEFIYQMNRHRYWICLGQAYSLTKNEKYAKAFVEQLFDWIESNPLNLETKNTVWRTIEAGIRAENWIKAIGYFERSTYITSKIMEQFFLSLEQHANYLFQTDLPFSEKSNWGVIENHGLYIIAKAMEWHPKKEQWRKTALSRLLQCLRTQIFRDGVQWEQSFMYHNEVLKCYLELLRIASRKKEVLISEFYEVTKKMACFNLFAKKPNHCQISAGDSDETDLRDVITASGIQFLDGRFKYVGYEYPDFESIWEYGKKAGENYINLKKIALSYGIKEFNDSGNYFYRSGWDENADFLHFKCGSLGGGHGHFDKLHIDLVINGEDVLIDSGRYTYVDSQIRHRLKSASAHNTILLDEKEYTESIDSWGVKNLTMAVKQDTVSNGDSFCMQGGHLGYIKDGIFLNRKVIAIHSKLYVIADCFYGTGIHTSTQLFHLNPNGLVEQKKRSACFIGTNGNTLLYPLGEDIKLSIEDTEVSNRYNEKELSKVIKIKRKDKFPSSLLTVIIGSYHDENDYKIKKVPIISKISKRVLETNEAEGIRIQSKVCDYLVVLSHLETGADCEYIGSCGIYGLGKVMLCDLNAEKKEMQVLEW